MAKGEKNFIKSSLLSPVLQAFATPVFMDLNIEEAENLLRIFGTNSDKDRSRYKLLRRGCKYGFFRASF